MSADARAWIAAAGLFWACETPVNHPPSFDYLEPHVVVVGERLEVTVEAHDPDGDGLKFAVAGLPEEAALAPLGAEAAVLLWTPSITDTEPGGRLYLAKLSADDARGGTASLEVEVQVVTAGGVPAFDLPGGIVLNLAQDDQARQIVAVKDDDSETVTLTMIEAPAGAIFDALGPKEGFFQWKPSKDAALEIVHHAAFRAEDHDHPPVEQRLMLVLLHPEGDGPCTGTPPVVLHEPPPDQVVDDSTALITATLLDAESAPSDFAVHWTTGSLDGPIAIAPLEESAKVAGLFSAALEVPSLSAAGVLVSYWFEGRDNDDPLGDACDHAVRVPKAGWFTTALYPPDAAPGACVDDQREPDDQLARALALGPGTHFGLRLCGTDVDLGRVVVAPGTALTARVLRDPKHGAVILRMRDATGSLLAEDATGAAVLRVDDPEGSAESALTRVIEVAGASPMVRLSYLLEILPQLAPCPGDAAEPNDDPASAWLASPGKVPVGLTLCPGDEDWFEIALAPGEELQAAIAFDHPYGDLDLDLLDSSTLLARAATGWSIETIRYVSDRSHSVWLRVHGPGGASNAYSLTIEVGPVGIACVEDMFGPNFAPPLARPLFSGFYDGLVVCPNAPDWYTITLNGGETLALQIETNQNVMTLSLHDDPTAAAIAVAAADQQGKAVLTHPVADAKPLYYSVQAAAPPTEYRLTQVVADPAGPCQADRYEPNDDPLSAVNLAPGVHTWLRLCPADVDLFRVQVPQFATLRVVTRHEGTTGGSHLQILAPDGVTIAAQAASTTNGVELAIAAKKAGLYTVVLEAVGVEGSQPYDLALEVE